MQESPRWLAGTGLLFVKAGCIVLLFISEIDIITVSNTFMETFSNYMAELSRKLMVSGYLAGL